MTVPFLGFSPARTTSRRNSWASFLSSTVRRSVCCKSAPSMSNVFCASDSICFVSFLLASASAVAIVTFWSSVSSAGNEGALGPLAVTLSFFRAFSASISACTSSTSAGCTREGVERREQPGGAAPERDSTAPHTRAQLPHTANADFFLAPRHTPSAGAACTTRTAHSPAELARSTARAHPAAHSEGGKRPCEHLVGWEPSWTCGGGVQTWFWSTRMSIVSMVTGVERRNPLLRS